MAKQERYFILLPTNGGGEAYYHVDPTRLHIGYLDQIYVQVHVPGKTTSYKRAFGVGPDIRLGLDLTEPLETFESLMEQIRISLADLGEGGERVQSALNQLRLPELLQATVACDRDLMKRILGEMLYGLQSVTCDIAGALEEGKNRIDQMATSVDHYAEMAEANVASQDFYVTWALNGTYLAEQARALEEIEQRLNAQLEAFSAIQSQWVKEMDPTGGAIHDATQFLNVDTEGAGAFIDQAFAYRDEPSLRTQMRTRVAVAERLIRSVRKIEQDVETAWDDLDRVLTEKVTPLQTKISEHLGDFRNYRRVFRTHDQSVPEGKPRPHTVPTPLMSTAEYQEALRYAMEEHWAPRMIQNRLSGLMGDIATVVADRPKLPRSVVEVLEMAERAIRECKSLFEEEMEGEAPSLPSPQDEGALPTAVQVGAPLPSVPPLQKEKADELYELVSCVFYILTLKKPVFLAATTLRNALKVIALMERCSVEERERYYPRLQQRFEREEEFVTNSKMVMTRQRESKQRWVTAKMGRTARHRLSKLTHGYEQEALALLAKHGLDEQKIRTAFEEHRAIQHEIHLARRSEEHE